ncbi:hypothetical protein [Fervidobacterium nodosum]|uniref:Fimbrial assembly family protein n=1 Tax=Fervidobacterium nodosum (strain ATCC 35602 / DSM 5306 / Rt17-B1) TaxID=381764 RepID=A7HMI1_FERNB|nr:hypothetical protein [Fervidobacterium nodosum]ABS61114.1 hypothetical protein Fnod_1267 [Fervidobacterium nodosum Rt17-B1]
MIVIQRKIAVLIAFFIMIVLFLMAGIYFYNSYYQYMKNLESKLSEVTQVYNKLKQLEQESEILAKLQEDFGNMLEMEVNSELISDDVEKLLSKILSKKVAEIKYFYMNANVYYPILFEATPVYYTVNLKVGGD